MVENDYYDHNYKVILGFIHIHCRCKVIYGKVTGLLTGAPPCRGWFNGVFFERSMAVDPWLDLSIFSQLLRWGEFMGFSSQQ